MHSSFDNDDLIAHIFFPLIIYDNYTIYLFSLESLSRVIFVLVSQRNEDESYAKVLGFDILLTGKNRAKDRLISRLDDLRGIENLIGVINSLGGMSNDDGRAFSILNSCPDGKRQSMTLEKQNNYDSHMLSPKYNLTRREKQIAWEIIEGLKNKEIREKLGITEGTVKQHVYNIFQKTKVNNRSGLIYLLRKS